MKATGIYMYVCPVVEVSQGVCVNDLRDSGSQVLRERERERETDPTPPRERERGRET